MNRFFASLAARAVGDSVGLQRRQPALFEPEAQALPGRINTPPFRYRASAADPGPNDLERSVEVTARPSPPAVPTRGRPEREPRDPGADVSPHPTQPVSAVESAPLIGDTSVASAPSRKDTAARAAFGASHSQRIAPAISADSTTEQVRTDPAQLRVLERGVIDRGEQVVIEPVPAEPERLQRKIAPAPDPVVLDHGRVPQRLEEDSAVNAESAARAVLPEMRVLPARGVESVYAPTQRNSPKSGRTRASADSQSQGSQVAEQGPAPIQVTIGRIEVRAILPTAATPRPRRQPPPSLDDFLRRRGRGSA